MRVLIAGGGTGGHVIPALAIAHELREKHDCEVIFAGTSRGIETRLVPAAGFELRLIDVGQLNHVSLRRRLKTLFTLPLALLEAYRNLGKLKPAVVISVGGYASGPAATAAVLRRIPLLIFEPNVVPGYANRKVARFAANAAIYFAETGRWFRRFEVTGVPVRRSFFEIKPKVGGAPTLLLFGGSQGAQALNRVLVASLKELKARIPALRIIHQTGESMYEGIAAAYREAGVEAEVSAFITEMSERFAEADLIVCRSGASTVAEVAAAGKAAIFVPLPTAADDHQRRNAEALVAQGAAYMIPEAELTRKRFVEAVSSLLNNRSKLTAIGEAARRLAHPYAAERIAAMAVELTSQHKSKL